MMGPTLYGLAVGGGMDIDITMSECLLFASFIIAVDPVAVSGFTVHYIMILCVFKDIIFCNDV